MSESRPRYRSIFWPLVLIAVGTLWLLSNFNVISGSNLFALVRLWPLLLIAIGLDILFGRRPLISGLIAVVTVGAMVAAVIFAPQLGLAGADWRWFNSFPGTSVRGSGTVIEQNREVSNFDGVQFAAFGELTIRQGERERLVITADDNLLQYIETEVRGGTLEIDVTAPNLGFNTTRPIRYDLTVKSLKSLVHSGAGNVELVSLSGGDLEVRLSGAGNVVLKDLDLTGQLDGRLSGAGNLEAVGQAARQDIVVSGFGEYRGGDLQTQSADIQLSGAGSATVWAEESLDARISGAGSVRYYGSPSVTKRVTGLGSVDSAGDK
jgi:hypothetical protein